MDIEQTSPNKPNFLLVVLLSCVTILCIFLAILLVLHWDGRPLIPHHVATPASQVN